MDIVSRLKQYLDQEEISVTQFADQCGIPRPSASQLLSGRNKKVSDEVISKIHAAYPALSMLWLLFGEGSMGSVGNIETSGPQNSAFYNDSSFQNVDRQEPEREFVFSKSSPADIDRKNFSKPDENAGEYVESGEVREEAEAPYGFPTPRRKTATRTGSNAPGGDTFTFTGETGKRVMSIVVFYDDNSFESFIPDPSRRNPFMR